MNIVGISGDCEHNSAVALIRDGELVYAEAEERLSRIKCDGAFPHRALARALERTGPGEVLFAAPGLPVLAEVLAAAGTNGREPGRAACALRERAWFEIELLAAADAAGAAVERVEHHRAHARCAAYLAGGGDALVVTADGQGDGVSAAVWRHRDGALERLWDLPLADGSPGFFFAAVTEILGYRRLRDEGKVTALAAAGAPHRPLESLMAEVLAIEPGSAGSPPRLRVDPERVAPWSTGRPLHTPRFASELGAFAAADVARAAQERLEAAVLALLAPWTAGAPGGLLAVAGGLFANVRVNRRLAELPGVSRVAVAPPMGDEGLAVGAAVEAALRRGVEVAACRTMLLGSPAVDGDLEDLLARHPGFAVDPAPPHEAASLAARLLADGHVVARCAGPGELGPRALGNRSLLYRPDDPGCGEWLNRHLGRDPVMPFAPCVRREDLPVVTPVPAELYDGLEAMTVAVPVSAGFRRLCPGVVHGDGTARVQAVRRAAAPQMWALLDHFHQLTGLPALLNTSLNRHGEPICGGLADALVTAAASGIELILTDGGRLLHRSGRTAPVRLAASATGGRGGP
ncbi:MAG TPA: carbamoyltransferase C-terminal domain-containing protein [Thermoanaerobaculia bacterium]|nr:carbamoyltransferase C-terminal domain-containing protein [Thermoanaerobaculia bacterium]